MTSFVTADTDEKYMYVALLFNEYAAWLNIDLGFQHFDDELLQLKTMYGKPGGGIIFMQIGK